MIHAKTKNILMWIVSILIIASLASIVQAGVLDEVGDVFSAVSTKFGASHANVQDANTGITIYDNNKNIIDFFVMFVLFMSLSYLGLKKFMGDDTGGAGNAAKGLAFAVGLALALASMKAGISPGFFIPFVKNALFLIIFMIIFLLLKSDAMLGKDRPVMAFILALVIAWAAFNVFNIVADKDKKFDLAELWSSPTATRVDNMNVQKNLVKDKMVQLGLKYKIPKEELQGEHDEIARKVRERIIAEIEIEAKSGNPDADKNIAKMMADRENLANLESQYLTVRDKVANEGLRLQPSVPSNVRITPTNPGPNDDLTCTTSGSGYRSKANDEYLGEIGYKFIWKNKDGGVLKSDSLTSSLSSTLQHTATAESDAIRCEVTAEVRGQASNPATATVTIRSSAQSDLDDDARKKFSAAEQISNDDAATSDKIENAMNDLASLRTNGQRAYTKERIEQLYSRLSQKLDRLKPQIELSIAPDGEAVWDEAKSEAKGSITYRIVGGRANIPRTVAIKLDGTDARDVTIIPRTGNLVDGETIQLVFGKKGSYQVYIEAQDGSSKPVRSNVKSLVVGSEKEISDRDIDEMIDTLGGKDPSDAGIDELLEALAK